MCQECFDEMSNEGLEKKPQTIDQCLFWLEIGGYSVQRYPGFWNDYSYIVALPNGVQFSLDTQRMREHAIAVWWQYNLT